MASGLMRAKTSFFGAVLVDGVSVEVDIHAGQVVRDSHPAIAGREHMFESMDEDAAPSPTPPAPRRLARKTAAA